MERGLGGKGFDKRETKGGYGRMVRQGAGADPRHQYVYFL